MIGCWWFRKRSEGTALEEADVWDAGKRSKHLSFTLVCLFDVGLFSNNLQTLSLFMGNTVVKSAAKSLDPEAGNICCSVLF